MWDFLPCLFISREYSCFFENVVPIIFFIMALPFGLESVNIKCKSGRAKILGTLVCIGGALLLTLYKGKPLFNYASATSIEKTGTSSSSGRWTIGVVTLILGTLFWSSWYIVQLSISKRFPCQYSSTALMIFFGSIQAAFRSLSIQHHDFSIWVLNGKLPIIAVLFFVSH
ncbi:WAT1-related protein At3g30340-like [Arachis stenosperma]|uniref:WAT1-related protein At3g30340-like n=1 Tax=Arachis stenosperma TaxID=217475 RepID=UPI0025AB6E81|nr:WAT1-related protein At3g30340-like [Arachis stenosperma]